MMELQEIEELFKNVNRGAIKAFLRNAAVLKDPAATPEMKALAAENVKAISMNKPIPKPKAEPKPKKQKAAVAEQAIQPVQQPVTQTPAAAAPTPVAPVQPSPKWNFMKSLQDITVLIQLNLKQHIMLCHQNNKK